MTGWKLWLAGIVSALINGFASGVVLIVADPLTFNIDEGLKKLLTTSAILGIVGMANYLKQNPFPRTEWTPEERAAHLKG